MVTTSFYALSNMKWSMCPKSPQGACHTSEFCLPVALWPQLFKRLKQNSDLVEALAFCHGWGTSSVRSRTELPLLNWGLTEVSLQLSPAAHSLRHMKTPGWVPHQSVSVCGQQKYLHCFYITWCQSSYSLESDESICRNHFASLSTDL